MLLVIAKTARAFVHTFHCEHEERKGENSRVRAEELHRRSRINHPPTNHKQRIYTAKHACFWHLFTPVLIAGTVTGYRSR